MHRYGNNGGVAHKGLQLGMNIIRGFADNGKQKTQISKLLFSCGYTIARYGNNEIRSEFLFLCATNPWQNFDKHTWPDQTS